MVGRASALLLVCLLVVAAPALAQDVTGPAVAAPSTTLYAHSTGSGATKWLSTIQKDPAGKDTTVTMAFPGSANTGSTASFKLLPVETGPVILDTAQDILFNIRFGSGIAANYGTVSTKLLSGTTEIASATGTATQTVNSYGDVKLKAKATVAELPAGQDIVWAITFAGEGSAYIQVSQSDMWCNIVLPIVSAPAAAGNGTLNGTAGNATGNATAATGNLTAPPANTTAPSPTSTNTTAPANTTLAPQADATTKATPVLPLAPLVLGIVWAASRRRRAL